MKFSKNSKKAGLALVGSMAGFLMAKRLEIKEYYPFVLLGGFLGTTLGEELIAEDHPPKTLGYIDRDGQLKMISIY